jgi:hypothetical protein
MFAVSGTARVLALPHFPVLLLAPVENDTICWYCSTRLECNLALL